MSRSGIGVEPDAAHHVASCKREEIMPNHEQLPNNHVVGVINGAEAAEAARCELQQAGFFGAYLFEGDDVTMVMDPKGERAGPIASIFKAIQDHLSEEPNYLAQYQEEAKAGNEVIAVKADNQEQADAIREILERHGARNIRFFGRLAVADLTPASNPTPRSADSPERWTEA
jgi:hypothetical protein